MIQLALNSRVDHFRRGKVRRRRAERRAAKAECGGFCISDVCSKDRPRMIFTSAPREGNNDTWEKKEKEEDHRDTESEHLRATSTAKQAGTAYRLKRKRILTRLKERDCQTRCTSSANVRTTVKTTTTNCEYEESEDEFGQEGLLWSYTIKAKVAYVR